MKKTFFIALVAIIITGCSSKTVPVKTSMVNTQTKEIEQKKEIKITPISHATMVLGWDDKIIYTDPVGGSNAFQGQPQPDLILITDIHQDHLNLETLKAVVAEKTIVVVPKAVVEMLPAEANYNLIILNNNESTDQLGFNIKAVPAYNLPEDNKAPHTKGRGNGYVVEKNNQRVYIAGDTADIPEMRALQNIDIAFIPMNLPYTMSIESATSGVLAFKPKKVYPYHYREPNGFANITKFKELINAGNSEIEVVLLDWYGKK